MEQEADPGRVRRAAGEDDFEAVGSLLDRFNREFDCPTPGAAFLAARAAELDSDEFASYLARDEDGVDVGVAVLRFRPALWAASPEAYLAELYVVPDARRAGLGGELMEAMLEHAKRLGCEWIEVATGSSDTDAHRLYERYGFSNLEPDSPPEDEEHMLMFERSLP